MKHTYIFWSILERFYRHKKKEKPGGTGRSIVFENTGRSGYAVFRDGDKSTRFYTEVGGGDCIFYMVIPSAEQWEIETGYPLENRDEILTFIAEESIKKQANVKGAYYKIQERHIVFYQK